MKNKKFYVTTAIDYVNAKPHCGHAFEKCLADAIARWKKLQGNDVFFLTGVDENAQKNVQAAERAGIPVKQFVDKNTGFFIELCKKLNIQYNDFIRTTAKEHAAVVTKIVKKIIDNGDIYKSKYEGHYCIGCEAFITDKDLVDGKCPEHSKEPEFRKEEAYFFRLSKYQKKLLRFIPKYVVPEIRKNEVLARVKEGLNDVCISRKNAEWGIDFPGDKNFKVWVWVDALINYISGLKDNEKKYWPAQLHIIGKGINWFHSVIWPALLMAAGYKLPETLLVHGYLTLGGGKISKSLGNVIDPLELAERYSADSIRYSLFKCSVFDDSDYSEEILIKRNNNELADKLGNLVSRVSALAEKYGLEKTENKLLKKLKIKEISGLIENYELDKALNLIFEFVDSCNLYVQENELWKSCDRKKLYELADSIKAMAILLWSFIPETSEKIAQVFSFKIDSKELKKPLKISKIKKAEILFKKIEVSGEKVNKPQENKKIEGLMKMGDVSFNEWEKLELRVGKIIKAEDIEGADKLYKLEIDLGKEKRIVVAGLKKFYSKPKLINKKCILFANLASRIMRGIESQGMILAAVNEDESQVKLIQPDDDIELGARVR